MGADITAFVEVKHDGEWHCLNTLDIRRDRNLFYSLGYYTGDGLRANPRGIPEDASAIVKLQLDYCGDDAHRVNYLGYAGIAKIVDWYESANPNIRVDWDKVFGYAFGDCVHCLSDDFFNDKPIQDLRVVYWFDQ